MARVAAGDRPTIAWDAVGEAIDRPVTVNRTAPKPTVDDIPTQLRALVEAAYRDKLTKVVPIDHTRDGADAMAKEMVRLARLYGSLREPQLSVGASVVPDCKVPGRSHVIPLAVTIGARDKITRPRKNSEANATVNGGTPPAAPVAAPVAATPSPATASAVRASKSK